MAISAFTAVNAGKASLGGNNEEKVLVRLQLGSGKFIVFGRVLIANLDDGSSQNAGARLTTFDGATELDRADVRISPAGTRPVPALTLP
jgi:hypothetical protein